MKHSLLALIFLLNVQLMAQNEPQQMLEEWAAQPALRDASIGLVILDAVSGRQLAGINEKQGLSPASSLKVLTTAAALDLLGNKYRYETKLYYSGELIDGTLEGDLWIIGGGDPSLGANRFDDGDMPVVLGRWVDLVKNAGIKKIRGAVVGDGSHFQGVRAGRGWPWEDVGNYYGAGVWGLNLRENYFEIDFQLQADRRQAPKLMGHNPLIPHLTLVNELSSGSPTSGDQAYIFGGPYNYQRFIRGSLPAGSKVFTIKGSLPDAPFFAAYHLKEALNKNGITAGQASTWIDHFDEGKPRTLLGTILSASLTDLVEAANQESINLYCEAFLRSLNPDDRSSLGGITALKKWMDQSGINSKSLRLMDGSGLSPQNRISAKALAGAVQQGIKNPAFLASLPLGNQDGTAKYLFRGEPNAHLIRVKSGYIQGVRSYTGVVNTLSGKQLTFCFILNNYSCSPAEARSLLEDLMIGLPLVE